MEQVTHSLELWTRRGISIASLATSIGFTAAQQSTKLGFKIARSVTTTAVTVGTTVLDFVVVGGDSGTGTILNSAVVLGLNLAEQIALAPILIGQTLTTTSLGAASESIDVLTQMFGTHEASFSLAAFVQLVRREWNTPFMQEHLPVERPPVYALARAIVAWAALQCATRRHHEKIWKTAMDEISETEWLNLLIDHDKRATGKPKQVDAHSRNSRVLVTDDVLLPHDEGQIITADIGEADSSAPPPSDNLRLTLRRLSKIVLGGYGGAGLLFFGVPFHSNLPAHGKRDENTKKGEAEKVMAQVIQDAEEDETEQKSHVPTRPSHTLWDKWNIVRGKRDQEIFEKFAFGGVDDMPGKKSTAVLGTDERIPRYWILTDHSRNQIVLVLRGTMSINELAVDLTCDPEDFEPASAVPQTGSQKHQVHSGMLRVARAMGGQGKPVHTAVSAALRRNQGYELVLCGHSLGAGVATLLALMWADPRTCLTVSSSGLSVGRRVSAYCFAPPCVTSPELSRMSEKLVTSFVYSHDVVSRLGLGSIRDLTRAAWWLCEGKDQESSTNVIARSLAVNAWFGLETNREYESAWLLSLRKTLEANMHMTELFPTGRVFWAIRSADIGESDSDSSDKLRIFRVNKVETVFNQVIFARDMLSAHMPNQYDRVLHDVL